MAVDGGAHLLPHQQGGDLLLRGDELTSLGLLQGLPDESSVALDLSAWVTFTYPESSTQTFRGLKGRCVFCGNLYSFE